MPFRSFRPAALFAALLLLTSPLGAGGALAQATAVPKETQAPKENSAPKESLKDTKDAPAARQPRELSVGQSAARERQKTCGAEWRALSVSDKAAQGPKWPQYFSKCVKRLKQIKA